MLIDKYNLGYSISLDNFNELLEVSKHILENKDYKKENIQRRKKLIEETIDLTDFMCKIINNI